MIGRGGGLRSPKKEREKKQRENEKGRTQSKEIEQGAPCPIHLQRYKSRGDKSNRLMPHQGRRSRNARWRVAHMGKINGLSHLIR